MSLRLLRAGVVACLLSGLFVVSQTATLRREGEVVPGIGYALGVLTVLFLVRAAVTERTRGPEAVVEKDLLWGLFAGGVLSLAWLAS